ncbi:MAG: esterase-like activity of phytase family protein [Verrucomicrobiae bacterium]|nr:esterase-like activity of phytase family protein [Verrucomicrobiae bacterium]
MKQKTILWILSCLALVCLPCAAQFNGFTNLGLVAVGRVPGDAFDVRGPGLDSLGGFGSATYFDWGSAVHEGRTVRGTLYALPDRGFGDGAQNYLTRILKFSLAITPYEGPGPAPQNQISLVNTGLIFFTYERTNHYTGFDANDTNVLTHPQSAPDSLGQGRRSLDGEGLVRLPDGRFYVSDEYGPYIYRFSADGNYEMHFKIPESLMPKFGAAYPRKNYFTAVTAPVSGRRNNRGLEGLSITPDGKRLFAMLQSPTIQDGGAGTAGRNTRVVVFDADESSPTYGEALAMYVYVLTLNGSAQTNRHTPVSEILALNHMEFLVLERDQIGQGLTGTNIFTAPTYKRVVLASIEGATNIIDSPYNLELGAPGQLSLPASGLPSSIKPVTRMDLVDMLDEQQLAKFGLNASAPHDTNTIPEKMESLALIPLFEGQRPDDYLLLVISDNDFKAPVVYHNGEAVGTNEIGMDTLALAYRVTLPTYGAAAPSNQPPGVVLTGPTNAVLALPVSFKLVANAYDQDGKIVKVQYYQGTSKVSEDTAYPFELAVTLTNAGLFAITAVAYDHEGAAATSSVYQVETVTANLAPLIALRTTPAVVATSAPVNFTLIADVQDVDGWISRVVFYRNGVAVRTNTAAPYQLGFTNHPLGDFLYQAVVTDNLGLSSTSAPVLITARKNTSSPPLTVQILHASDFEASLNAIFDAPAFSAVLNGLKAQYPTNTLIVSSGDNYIPGPFFNASADPAAGFNGVAGRGDIVMFNAMGFQASAFGNHEFDAGTPQVRNLILRDAAVNYAGTLFPYLSANLNFATDSSMASLVAADGQPNTTLSNRVARSCIVQVAGQWIGLVGVTTPELRAISSPGNIQVDTNLVTAVQAAVDALLPLGVNKVIVLAHLQQFANEFALAQQLRDVDVVIAGGSHAIFAKPQDRLRPGDVAVTNYPVWFNSTLGQPVAVVNAGANYRYVGRFIVRFDEQGLITSYDPASGVYATDEQGIAETGNQPPNATVLNVATNLGAIINAKDGLFFGRTLVYLNGLRQFVRTEESNLGNLTADANLWRGRLADPTVSISLKNGGGIRDSIGAVVGYGGGAFFGPPLPNPQVGKPAGAISQLDIENALRFNNGLTLLTLTAQQLRDTMEWSVAATAPGATPGQFPQVSGLWFSYQPTNPPMTYARSNTVITGIATPGSRVQTLVARRADGTLDLVVDQGQLVGDPNRTFRLVTLGFLADGGDSYYPLTQAADRVDLAPASGNTFFTDGGEQWALAGYLTNIQVYAVADTPMAWDQRIQNLALRNDTVSHPQIVGLSRGPSGPTLRVMGLPGFQYRIQYSTDLRQWFDLGQAAEAGGGLWQYQDGASTSERRFYRVIRLQP